MAKRPTLTPPAIGFSAFDGDIVKHIGKSANLDVAIVHQELGGAEGLLQWTLKDPENMRDFYTKLFPKIMQKNIEHSATEGVEAILKQVAERQAGQIIDVDCEEIEDAPEE